MTEENHGEMSKYQLKKLIKELEDIRGRNTELVSLYVPAGYDMSKISEFVTSESSEAENIKSKHTRKNVQAALDKIGRKVKEEQQTPENGVVFFAGNVSDTEGRPDIQIWEVVPPQPVESRHYRCDKEFVIQPLKDMVTDDRVYGLIVADKNEAAIGYLEGSRVKTVYTLDSNVPGKTRAGGQCLDPDTVVHMSDGKIKKIRDIEIGDRVKSADFQKMSFKDSEVQDKWSEEKEVYRLETKNPKMILKASQDHEVFVGAGRKKTVGELEPGEKLLFPEKISTSSRQNYLSPEKYYNSFEISQQGVEKIKKEREDQNISQEILADRTGITQTAISKIELGERNVKNGLLADICRELSIEFTEFVQDYCSGRIYTLPTEISPELAEIIGYFLGDGSFDPERLNFHEQDKEVAEYYRDRLENVFNTNTSIRFREDKNYYLLRAQGKPLVEFLKNEFPGLKKSRDSRIPEKILEERPEILVSFIKGFYDAEGSCSHKRKRIGVSANNEVLVHQLQSALQSLNIVSSLTTYDNRSNPYSNNTRYTLDISDQKSIRRFAELINFTSEDKQEELLKTAEMEKSRNKSRQVLEKGEAVRGIVEKHGKLMEDFKSSNSYLQGKRNISKRSFRGNLVDNSEGELKAELEEVLRPDILPAEIDKIENIGGQEVIDISVEAGNFIANNLVVHNSAQRFARLRESMYDTFLKDIAEKAKNAFLEKAREDKLLGIIVGGPGFTKDKLLDDGYLHQELQDKVVARESLNYSGAEALEELVSKAEDAIQDSQVVKEKNLVNQFFENLKEENGKSEYGLEQVLKALNMGAVDTLLISENFDHYQAKYECPNGHEDVVYERKPEIEQEKQCPECNESMELEEISDVVDVLGEKAEEMSSELEIISSDHEEGARLENMGGIAAILRYRIR